MDQDTVSMDQDTVKKIAEVVHAGLRKSAAELRAKSTDRWMDEIDAKLLEGSADPADGTTTGVFSEILQEVEDEGVDIGVEDVGDASEEMWVIDVRSRQLEIFRARQKMNYGKSVGRLELGSTQIGGKEYMVRIVPANHASDPPQDHLYEKVVLRP